MTMQNLLLPFFAFSRNINFLLQFMESHDENLKYSKNVLEKSELI